MNSDTPRTDAVAEGCDCRSGYWVSDTFAETLERELNAARATIARLEHENNNLTQDLECHKIATRLHQATLNYLSEQLAAKEAELQALKRALNVELGVWKYDKQYGESNYSRIHVDMRIEAIEAALNGKDKP